MIIVKNLYLSYRENESTYSRIITGKHEALSFLFINNNSKPKLTSAMCQKHTARDIAWLSVNEIEITGDLSTGS